MYTETANSIAYKYAANGKTCFEDLTYIERMKLCSEIFDGYSDSKKMYCFSFDDKVCFLLPYLICRSMGSNLQVDKNEIVDLIFNSVFEKTREDVDSILEQFNEKLHLEDELSSDFSVRFSSSEVPF